MDLGAFVNKHSTNDSKKANLMNIKGGKTYVPEKDVKKLYKLIRKTVEDGDVVPPFAEKIGKEHPLIFDVDIKYTELYTNRQYTLQTLQGITELLWSSIKEFIDVEDINQLNTVYITTKQKPYPCNKGKYKSKDGLHIIFPKIILNRDIYKFLCKHIQENQESIFTMFKDTCENPPSNLDNTLMDGSFSLWMPYLCHKQNEEPYLLEEVFIMSLTTADRVDPELVKSDDTIYTPDVLMMEMSMIRPDIKENVAYTEFAQNKLKSKSSQQSSMVATTSNDDLYAAAYVDNNNVINPYKIVEEEELKLITNLCGCLSIERACEYGKWLDVGLALHNTNSEKLLPVWEKFSQKYSKYRDGSSKRNCAKKWESFKNGNSGNPLTVGSLRYWANTDDPEKYNKVMVENLGSQIEKSIDKGPEAHHLIGLVIHKYYQDQFLCVDIGDDWYFFNGVRWKKTLKANELKRRIHDDIYNIYHEYSKKYKDLMNACDEDSAQYKLYKDYHGRCTTFQNKLLQENYVNTLIGALRHQFYKEGVAEEFDSNLNLLGLDNAIVDLKEWVIREGRPEDYITKTTGFELPGEAGNKLELPIKLTDINTHLSKVLANYDCFRSDLKQFITQIIPIDEVRAYAMRFMSKCLSGENRDEGFYIWTGSGGNGKSKLIELAQMVLGEYACGLPVSLITSKRASSNSATPEMERTKGVRLVVMQEPEADENINIGLMKELTGNDKIIARGLYKEPVEFVPQYKLLLMCNDLPNIPSNDDGTWRRLEVVDFISKFVGEEDYDKLDEKRHVYKRDKEMRKKLPAWKLIFFGILLEEWMKYDVDGITVPPQVNSKTKSYRSANDIVSQWIEQSCEISGNETKNGVMKAPTSFQDLWDDFDEWCKDQGHKYKKSKMKDDLFRWQESSEYGLSLGKRMSDGCSNGTRKNPYFNIVVIEDEEE